MFPDRRSLSVFHERDLEKILVEFNLLEKFKNKELTCSVCKVIITKDNLGCIYLSREGKIEFACSNPECLEAVNREIQDV